MNDQNKSLNLFGIYDPRVNISEKMVGGDYAVVKGGQQMNMYNYPSNSSSNTGVNWSNNPPGKEHILSRLLGVEIPITLDFTGNSPNAGQPLLLSNFDALRAFPLENIVKNCIVTINGCDINVNLSEVVGPFSRYYLDNEKRRVGITPNMLDNFAKYSDAQGSNNNPLATFKDMGAIEPRGAYSGMRITANTETAATVEVVLRAYLMISPFEWLSAYDNDIPGLTKIDTFSVNISFVQNISKVWSRVAAPEHTSGAITTFNATVGNNSIMHALWITPRDELKEKIRNLPEIKYPFYKPVRYVATESTPVIAGRPKTMESQVINLSSIPTSIYVYMTRSESEIGSDINLNMNTTDSYFAPDRLSITWNNNSGVLNTMQPQQLYDLCVKNGLRGTTYSEFRGITPSFSHAVGANVPVNLCSAPIRIVPGEDFPLGSFEAPGLNGKWNMQVEFTAINTLGVVAQPQLNILVVYEGYLAISDSRCYSYEGPLREIDIKNVKMTDSVSWKELTSYYGGAKIGDRFRNFGSKVVSAASKANKVAKDTKAVSKALKIASRAPTRASPLLEAASEYAQSYGYGAGLYEGNQLYHEPIPKNVSGGRKPKKVAGGKKLTNKDLQNRLRYI